MWWSLCSCAEDVPKLNGSSSSLLSVFPTFFFVFCTGFLIVEGFVLAGRGTAAGVDLMTGFINGVFGFCFFLIAAFLRFSICFCFLCFDLDLSTGCFNAGFDFLALTFAGLVLAGLALIGPFLAGPFLAGRFLEGLALEGLFLEGLAFPFAGLILLAFSVKILGLVLP